MILFALYANLVGVCLCLGLLAAEQLGASFAIRRRFFWLTGMAATVALPVLLGLRDGPPMIRSMPTLDVGTRAAPLSQAGAPSLLRLGQTLEPWFMLVWLITSLALFGLGVRQSLRLRALMRHQRYELDGTAVVLTTAVGPAAFGVRAPVILVPRWVLGLSPDERALILRHEREHIAARDPRLLFIASVLITLLPWNAALWWQLRRLHLAIEADCDARVIAGGESVDRYAALLVDVAAWGARGPRMPQGALSIAGMLEHRLTTLLNGHRGGKGMYVAGLATVVLAALIMMLPPPSVRMLRAAAPTLARAIETVPTVRRAIPVSSATASRATPLRPIPDVSSRRSQFEAAREARTPRLATQESAAARAAEAMQARMRFYDAEGDEMRRMVERLAEESVTPPHSTGLRADDTRDAAWRANVEARLVAERQSRESSTSAGITQMNDTSLRPPR